MTQVSQWFEGVRPQNWTDTQMGAVILDSDNNTLLFFRSSEGKAIEIQLTPDDRERLKNVWRVNNL